MKLALASCARPKLGRHSTYTVLGFIGYFVATILGVILARVWSLPLGERLIAFVAPPAAFVVTVTIATSIKKREWIVFYQALFAAVGAVVLLALVTGADV
ncbi:MAG TPA: hypothetical protein VK427_08850, partial [Kofleriaceae bacterium]|nr:hypothetical protein [Kofleriaceae bacterium]